MEHCVICSKNSSSAYYRGCLRCHKLICSSCQPKHTTAYKDHAFRFPEIRSAYTYCKQHNLDFNSYCQTCSKPICKKCTNDGHRHHPCVDAKELKKQLAFDESNVKETLRAIHDDIQKRVNEIGTFDVTLRRINNRINSIRPKEFVQLEKQLNELKASKYFYEEIQRYQKGVFNSTTDNDFLEKYEKFQELKLHFIVNPPACEEIPKLPLIHNAPTDEDIFSFLYTKELSKTSLEFQKSSDLESHIKEELETKKQEIQILKGALYCMLNNIDMVSAAWRHNTNEPKTVQFKAPQAPCVNKETEEVLRKYEKCMEDVIGIMNKKCTKVLEKQNEVDRKTIKERTEISEKDQLRLEHIKKENDELKMRKDSFEKEQLVMQTRLEDLNKENEEMKRRFETLSDQFQIKKMENEDLKTRLSQVAGAKLTAGNSSIADLGDKNRPTRIAEMYSELYDTEWTDTFDKLVKENRNWTEEYILRHLFIVLQGCFRTCKEIANEQMTNMCIHMFPNVPPSEIKKYIDTHTTEIKQIRDARKGTAINVGKFLAKTVYDYDSFNDDYVRYQGIDQSLIQRITKSDFGEKCAMICWLMVVQDPEMDVDRDIQKGEIFNKDVYKEYTKSGKRVAYSVWPALFLHEGGSLLTKGVVQCYN